MKIPSMYPQAGTGEGPESQHGVMTMHCVEEEQPLCGRGAASGNVKGSEMDYVFSWSYFRAITADKNAWTFIINQAETLMYKKTGFTFFFCINVIELEF